MLLVLFSGGIIYLIFTFKSAVVSPACFSHSSEAVSEDIQDFTAVFGELKNVNRQTSIAEAIFSTHCLSYPLQAVSVLPLLCLVLSHCCSQ